MTMTQRIYDRACVEMEHLKQQWSDNAELSQSPDFRNDVYRKHRLFLQAHANFVIDKSAQGGVFNANDERFVGLNRWARTITKDFIPDQEAGFLQNGEPQVSVLKTKIPQDIRQEFDRVVMNVMIKKAYIEHHISQSDVSQQKAHGMKKDLQGIKEELTHEFDGIVKQSKNTWSDMRELMDDYVDALAVLDKAQRVLKEKDPFELELE